MCGYVPVVKLHRLGTHTGFWQKALRNETASFPAHSSRNGVRAAGLPRCPMLSARIWSGLKMMMFTLLMSGTS